MKYDVYDFDKTVVPFDSALKYWGFCMLHNPWIILLLPLQFVWGVLMLCHIISVRTCKRVAFLYINLINNERNVKRFWDRYERFVFDAFKPGNRARPSVLISASPDFLIGEIGRRLGFERVIATTHSKTGLMVGEVCRMDEKARRLEREMPGIEVADVYSDNVLHDRWIFELGERNFLVTNGEIREIDLGREVEKAAGKRGLHGRFGASGRRNGPGAG